VCDVGDEAQVEAAFAQSVAALGPIDAVFANAGVSSKGTPLVDMDLQEFRRVQRVNVEGVFLTLRASARHMVQQGRGGSLVVTASTAAVEGAAHNSHDGASKGAVTAMVRALAVKLARHKIRVNSILPGWIETDMTEKPMSNSKVRRGRDAAHPGQALGQHRGLRRDRGVPGERCVGVCDREAVFD
jgi:NAD(P)-dependent dehydrogenase (short-subunit alcohol dehydrogenase family)